MTDAAYHPSARARIKRNPKRAEYDRATIHAIVDAAAVCHIAYVIDGQPYCTPTLHWRDGERLYWHGSSASRMLRNQARGLPVCLTVTHLDGLVLARSAFNHSANFRSAMVFGTAHLVEDAEEKRRALEDVTDRLFPGRRAELREMTAQEIKATSVVAMDIEEASAKVRAVNVGDDDEDGHLPVWAGVIPVRQVIGTDWPSPLLPAATPRPAHLAPFAEGRSLDDAMLETAALWRP
ncbi:MAG: pyridoxamine 5'-phosphate oxidase family protein [Gemmobacter sp.]|nr:pyridoxamine 5'-phosphate oxidase family protein [Gemmobacter sp.]